MAINDLPILSALRTKMQWHQERQRVLAENVSNANTPNFRPSDLVEPKFDSKGVNLGGAMGSLGMMRTSATHISVSGGGQSFRDDGAVEEDFAESSEIQRPRGWSLEYDTLAH